MRWWRWQGDGRGSWSCYHEPRGSKHEGPCCEDDRRQRMRNCPRTDLGHEEPYGTNAGFDLALGKTKDLRLLQCPCGMITERSQAFIDLFLDCHSEEAGWGGVVYRQHGWPSGGGVFDERNVIVQAFRLIRNELKAIEAERERK